jgi:quercetin dioxygenase-like cupin family protein
MQAMAPGVTKANSGLDGIVWNILGQTYVPKQLTEASFAWHATLPPTTFVPPHIHPTQDEFVYMLEGRMDALIDGKEFAATAGDLIKLPMGIPHGLFNKSDQVLKCLFWVTPTRKLYDLFWAIHSMKDQNPPDVVALSAKHEGRSAPSLATAPAHRPTAPARHDRIRSADRRGSAHRGSPARRRSSRPDTSDAQRRRAM